MFRCWLITVLFFSLSTGDKFAKSAVTSKHCSISWKWNGKSWFTALRDVNHVHLQPQTRTYFLLSWPAHIYLRWESGKEIIIGCEYWFLLETNSGLCNDLRVKMHSQFIWSMSLVAQFINCFKNMAPLRNLSFKIILDRYYLVLLTCMVEIRFIGMLFFIQ